MARSIVTGRERRRPGDNHEDLHAAAARHGLRRRRRMAGRQRNLGLEDDYTVA